VRAIPTIWSFGDGPGKRLSFPEIFASSRFGTVAVGLINPGVLESVAFSPAPDYDRAFRSWKRDVSSDGRRLLSLSLCLIFVATSVATSSRDARAVNWRANRTLRDAAVNEIARQYRECIDIFQSVRESNDA
jgi:hypothetical protein